MNKGVNIGLADSNNLKYADNIYGVEAIHPIYFRGDMNKLDIILICSSLSIKKIKMVFGMQQ